MNDSELKTTGERFCSISSYNLGVGDQSRLVYPSADRTARLVPNHLALLLGSCRSFKTLDEHASKCAQVLARSSQRLEPASIDLVRQQLSALADTGLLISERTVLEACGQSGQAPPEIASVGVITRNRIDSLQRCLISYIENARKFGRTNDFVVMDDSEDATYRTKTRDMLSSLKREYAVDISYAGLEEKSRFAQALASEDLDPDLVNFALTDADNHEFSCGKNRNALLLHTIGDLVFSTDDDAVCRIVAAPVSDEAPEQEATGQTSTPTEFWFFADRDEALNFASFVDQDLLALHEQLLGRKLADCLTRFRDVSLLSLEPTISHYLRALRSDEGRVLVTLTGMIGDSGIRVPVNYKVLGQASRLRLIESGQTYLSGCSSREILRVATRYCLSNRPWFVSTALGFDNRDLLPPFFPVLRGTDGVFSDTLRHSSEYDYFGDVPYAILHAPMERRVYTKDAMTRSAKGITMNSLISACIQPFKSLPGVGGRADKLIALGRHLQDVGKMSLADFEEFARIHLWRERISLMAHLEKELKDYQNPPDYWVNDLRKYLTMIRESLIEPDYVVPEDLLENRGIDEARHVSRQLVSRFGRLLRYWPDLIEAAIRLRAKEHRLAMPV